MVGNECAMCYRLLILFRVVSENDIYEQTHVGHIDHTIAVDIGIIHIEILITSSVGEYKVDEQAHVGHISISVIIDVAI